MKTNFKRIGKQSISIVLAVMMMLSTMLVGTVTSNAAISYWVLRGTFNEWKTDAQYQFGGPNGGSITYDLSDYKGQTVEFRTDAYENGNLNMNSSGGTVVADTEYQLNWGTGTTMKYTVSSTGTGKVTFTVNSKNGGNYLTVTEGDQPITVTPYYVAGEVSLVNGSAWTAAQDVDKMSYDETTEKYSITYDKKAAGTYKFKIIEDSSTWRGYTDFTTVTGENCTVSDVNGNDHNIQIVTTEESNITITLDATNKILTISAESTTQKYTVTVDSNITNGKVTTSATSSLAEGETFTVTATPNDGYELDTVTVKDASGNAITANSDGSYTMPASNVTVSATFKAKAVTKYAVTYTAPTGDGVASDSIDPSDSELAEGTTVKVTVTVKDGYTASLDVDDVDVTTSTSGNTYTFTFTMPAKAITVAPKVAKKTANVVYLKNSANWSSANIYVWYTGRTGTENEINGNWPGAVMESLGDSIYCYKLDSSIDVTKVSFIFNDNGSDNRKTGDLVFSEHVGQIYDNSSKTWSDYTEKYTVSTSYDASKGTVTTSATSLAEGETFTVDAVPNDGYSVDKITVTDADGKEVTKNEDGSYTMPASNVTVTVTFKANENNLTFTEPTDKNCVSSSITPAAGSVAYGTEVTVVVTVKDGYAASLDLGDVKVTTTVEGNQYTFTFAMPNANVVVAPAIGSRDVDTPIVTLNGSTTGSTLRTYVNKSETITANVAIPTDSQSYTEIDTKNSGFAQLTYNGTVVDWHKYVDDDGDKDLTIGTPFKFGAPGTYQLTYNGVVYSTVDNTKTAAANATLNIVVTYSDVQQAYNDLQALIADTVNYPESVTSEQYSSGVDAYNSARAAAAAAVKNDLPAYNATDIYTTLYNNLVNAKESLVEAKSFYIGGTFNTGTVNNSTWYAHPDNIKFEHVSSNLYKVETGKNIRDNIGTYFFVYSKSGDTYNDYGAANATSNASFNNKTSLSNSVTLSKISSTGGKQLTITDGATTADNAIIWLDTSGLSADGTGSMKIFYTSGMPTAKYALIGNNTDWSGSWTGGYNADYLIDDSTDDNPFTFSTTITVDSENKAYFRLIDSNGKQYGINADNPTASVEITNVHYTTKGNCSTSHSFQISTPGTYRLFVDQSGATPVIWVESSDYTVSAVGQYTFNGNSYNNFIDAPPTVTVASTTVAVGNAVAVTATDNVEGYKFVGWTSSNGNFADSSELSTLFTPTGNNAVAVARYAKVLYVSVDKSDTSQNGSWTIGETNTVASEQTYLAGTSLSIAFTPENSEHIVTNVTVEGKDYTNYVYDNVLTFTAGVADEDDNTIQVIVTFSERPNYTFGFDYVNGSSEDMGTVSAYDSDGATLEEGSYVYGTKITLKAEPKDGYTFIGWYTDINASADIVSSSTNYTFELKENTTLYAKFAEKTGTLIPGLYLIYTTADDGKPTGFTQYLNLYYDSNNQVYAYLNDDTKFDTSKTYKFMISTSTGENSFQGTTNYNKGNASVYVTTTDSTNITVGKNNYGYDDGSGHVVYYYGYFSVKEDSQGIVSSVKINLGYYNNGKIQESADDTSYACSYEVIPTISGTAAKRVPVYAKDGTIRADYQKYAEMADTKFEGVNSDSKDITKYATHTYYDYATVKVGTTIKITTTIESAYRKKYFVKAFSINGYSYGIIDAAQADTTSGVYTCEYTIPEDFEGNRIEITPIYYYIDDTDTVTFYVEGFEETVQAKWGNTIAVQAWYKKGSDTASASADTKNAIGGYPGQPLVYQGGKYSMQIPKYLNGDKTNAVSGITLNNYFWDDIHKTNFPDQTAKSDYNCQTYDYDDFYKLANKEDVDNIIFDFRYRTKTRNYPAKTNLSDSKYNRSEVENLTDYYGNIVDLFGNILSKNWETDYDSQYLTVVSMGYVNNYIGSYATEWYVYDHDGKYIDKITCSQLLDENSLDKDYVTAYNKLKAYENVPVKIAYEMSVTGGDQKGDRADGRWYYSKKAEKISANVKIEYRTDDSSPFIEDPFVDDDSNIGTTTGTKAYFTNADYNGKTTCQGEVDGGNFYVQADTDEDAKYYFIGWYLKTSDGYAYITNDANTYFPMTNNETYVARFIPTPSGTLTLSHTLLAGSEQGRTYIKADIVDSDGNVKASIAETSGNLVIPSRYVTYTSAYYIKATLRTVPYGNDYVEDFYNFNKEHYNSGVSGTGEKTYSVTRKISELFDESTDSEGNLSYNLNKSNIPFYSNIVADPIDYQITYTYITRLNGKQSYVIKDKVSGMELEEMWAANVAAGLEKEQLSKTFITKKAPFVSNYREEIKWDIDNAAIKDYTATVEAKISTDDLKISALTVDGSWTLPTTLKYGELAMEDGEYLYKTGTTQFPDTFRYSSGNEYDFSFWAIFDNRDQAAEYSNAVTTYMSGSPAADMSERLTALTTLSGYENLIAKSYSKEYNYISYQDYYIVPVYADRFAKNEINEAQASIRLLEYTRNQWTTGNGVNGDGDINEGGSKTDYLYTDFALSFDKDQELIKDNANIKVGIAFEVVAKYDDIDLRSYVTDSNTDTIGDMVKNAASNGKVGSYKVDSDSADRNVYRYEINNSDISVKNRIEYYLRFKNSETSQQNVMKVYSYIYDKQSNEIYLSDPVYMNMYDIGNLTYITSDLASIDLQPATELG